MVIMKSVIKTVLFLSVLLVGHFGFTQVKSSNHSVKNNKMEVATNANKETIHTLYENIMNNRKFELTCNVVSEDYTNAQGGKGIEAFKQGIEAVIKAFPDAKWTLLEVIAEGNKVFVKQQVQGTHKGVFQNILPTNKFISNDGMVIYELANGKIINYQILTDRLGFLQQLEVIPQNLTPKNENTVYLVDKFFIPKSSIYEFTQRMKYNRTFIANLSGFVKDEAIGNTDSEGNLTVITIATWESQDKLNEAKLSVQTEYKRIGFNPAEFYQRLNIKMEREVYTGLID